MKTNQSDHLDQHFQNYFEQFQSQPSDRVWNDLEQRLAKKNASNRKLKIAGFLAGLVLALVLTTSLVYLGTDERLSVNEEISSPETETTPLLQSKKNKIKLKNNHITQKEFIPVISRQGIPATVRAQSKDDTPVVTESLSNVSQTMPLSANPIPHALEASETQKLNTLSPLSTRMSVLAVTSTETLPEWINKQAFDLQPETVTMTKRWLVTPWTSMARHDRSIEMNDNAPSGPVGVDLLESFEKPHVNLDFGVDFGYRLSNHWSLSTGIALRRHTNALEGYDMPVRYNSTTPLTGYVHSSWNTNEVNFYMGNLIGYEDGDIIPIQLDMRQTVNILSIPLSATYHCHLAARLELQTSAGISWNSIQSNKLRLNDSTYELTSFEHTFSEDVGRNFIGYQLDLALHYSIGQFTSIMTGPQYTGAFTPANENRHVLFTPRSLGWRIGLSRQF